MNCWRPAVTTRICTASSCWKKSWNAHEQPTRRRGTRQVVRFALDAAAAAVHGAVQVVGGPRAGAGGDRTAARTGAAALVEERDRLLLGSGDVGRCRRR